MKILKLFVIIFLFVSSAKASSPEAWSKFRNNVQKSCAKESENHYFPKNKNIEIFTENFGTGDYGVSVVRQGELYYLCLYDKSTKKVKSFTNLYDFQKDKNWSSIKKN